MFPTGTGGKGGGYSSPPSSNYKWVLSQHGAARACPWLPPRDASWHTADGELAGGGRGAHGLAAPADWTDVLSALHRIFILRAKVSWCAHRDCRNALDSVGGWWRKRGGTEKGEQKRKLWTVISSN